MKDRDEGGFDCGNEGCDVDDEKVVNEVEWLILIGWGVLVTDRLTNRHLWL